MKLKVQAQHLQPGDIVGSGEKVIGIVLNSTQFPSSKVRIGLENEKHTRITYWGKYTEINIERPEKVVDNA